MLTIAPEKVCYLIIKAREFEVKMEPEVPDPGDNPTDNASREILFDYPDDPTVDEIRAFLEGLNEDESAEVLALVWLGRGDYVVDEWKTIVSTALEDVDNRRLEALLGIPLLSNFLEEGLSQLGHSCEDVELGRL